MFTFEGMSITFEWERRANFAAFTVAAISSFSTWKWWQFRKNKNLTVCDFPTHKKLSKHFQIEILKKGLLLSTNTRYANSLSYRNLRFQLKFAFCNEAIECLCFCACPSSCECWRVSVPQSLPWSNQFAGSSNLWFKRSLHKAVFESLFNGQTQPVLRLM